MAGGVRPRRRGLVVLAAAAGLVAVGWLAPAPWLAEHWPRVLGVGLFLIVVAVPRWLVPARSPALLAGVDDPAARGRLEDDRLKLQNEVRTGLLQAVAGVAVIAAVVATWQQLDADRRRHRAEAAEAAQDRAAERFARAVDQLGSDRLEVRLGGIYGLERAAAEAARPDGDGPGQGDRVQAFEILSAYVRRASRLPPVGPPGDPALGARLPDVQAAVTVLGRRPALAGDPPLDLSGSWLPGARLDRARLAGARASAATRWPSGFDWRAAGAQLVEVCQA